MSHLQLHNFDFSKKIFFHPEKIVDYKQGRRPFPTTVEIDLANVCNHKCVFCNFADTLRSDDTMLETEVVKRTLKEAYALGTRGVSFTGGGEPMVHRDYAELIEYSKSLGIDNGTITNGSLIRSSNVEILNRCLDWIRISMAGGDRESYQAVQGVDHFEKVLNNVRLLLETRRAMKGKLNIGIKILVTPKNLHSLENLANILVETDIDYLQFNPDQYTTDGGRFWNSVETQSIFKTVMDIMARNNIKLLSAGFRVDEEKEALDYPRTCYAHFFQAAITAKGELTFCKNAREAGQYHLGNINEKSLTEIWNSDKVKAIESWIRPNNCGLFCKNMALNRSLESALHPTPDMTPNFVN